MEKDFLYDRILGCLVTAGLGDALGAATEQHHRQEIVAKYGGVLRRFVKPPIDTFAAGNEAGQITDDVSQMYYLAQALIDTNGTPTEEAWKAYLIRWADESPMARMMGPTTRLMIEAWRRGEDVSRVGTVGESTRKLTSVGTTNGAAMRIAPVGLVHPGDLRGACQTALVICLPTHDTQIAIAGACAIAGGVAAAIMPGADVFSVARACLEGARLGERLGIEKARQVAGPRVSARIELAISIALRARSLEEAMEELEAYVGNSVYTADSVPAAVGLFVYAGGDPMESIVGGANIGNDTDTIAAMAGALAGALRGFEQVPQELYAIWREANDVDVEALAVGLTRIAQRRFQPGDV